MLEDAATHYGRLQDHEWYMRDLYNKENPHGTAGRVPMALNGKETTWEDLKKLGIDPWKDPRWTEKYTQIVSHGWQGMDWRGAVAKAAGRGLN